MPKPSYSKYLASRYAGNRRYFSKASRLSNWKWILIWTILGLLGPFLYFSWSHPSWIQKQATHGELASVHSLWDQKCDACHSPQHPSSNTLATLFAPEHRWLDLKCQTCHPAPAHQRDLHWTSSKSESCASCHHDHQGRNNSLVRISDMHCTQCHVNLKDHQKTGNTLVANQVTDFTGDHPEFAVFLNQSKFERKMYFSHARHMSPGLVKESGSTAGTPKDAWTLARIPRQYVEFYRNPNQTDTDLVKLDCASCHQLDAQRSKTKEINAIMANRFSAKPLDMELPPRPQGAYFLPIQFSVHCQACHTGQLQTAHPLAGLKDQKTKASIPDTLELPHQLQPAALEQYLRNKLAADLLSVNEPLSVVPMRSNDRLDSNKAISQKRREELRNESEALLQKVQRAIYTETPATIRALSHTGSSNCLHCHLSEGKMLDHRPERIVRPEIPTIWNTKARFNHVSHRAVSCVECHQGTTYSPTSTFVEKEPLHLPGKSNCIQCHAPEHTVKNEAGSDARLQGGVRHSCTDCHRYHNGEHPLHGVGSPLRDPPNPRLNLEQFLRGISKKSTMSQDSEGRK